MELDVEFNRAAFKHGITEENIRYALAHPLHEQLLEEYPDKWLLIGCDSAGNLLEVAYNVINGGAVNVFHAMPCRKRLAEGLNIRGVNDG